MITESNSNIPGRNAQGIFIPLLRRNEGAGVFSFPCAGSLIMYVL